MLTSGLTGTVAPFVTSTGGAERNWKILSSDHPPSTCSAIGPKLGLGMSYVNPAENACRMSKSEEPRFENPGPTICDNTVEVFAMKLALSGSQRRHRDHGGP